MPWHVSNDHPDCSGWAVVKDSDNKVVGCHPTKAKALKQLAALNINVKEAPMSQNGKGDALPKENLYRALFPGIELRAAENGTMPILSGHFAVFNQWTEINSIFEGRFMESIAPGSFAKTIAENRDQMRVLFQHGHDPQVGDKPLGPIQELEEDKTGARYDVPLLDTSYVRDILPGLQAGLYGASFRFRVMREEINEDPEASAYNPDGLPERTIKEAQVMEFGPVTFPAYAGASAGVRSITDEVMFGRFADDPDRLLQLVEYVRNKTEAAPSTDDAGPTPTSSPERRETVRRKSHDYLSRREEQWKV